MMKKSRKQQRIDAVNKQKRQQRIIIGVGLFGFALLLAAMGMTLYSQAPPPIDVNDPQQVALGAQVYAAQCASCHGEELEGEENWKEASSDGLLKAPPHDETGHTWHHNNTYLLESVRNGGARLPAGSGVSPMPAYKDILSEEEIAASIAYIQSTWPTEIRIQQAQR